jgi:hypothetical protein
MKLSKTYFELKPMNAKKNHFGGDLGNKNQLSVLQNKIWHQFLFQMKNGFKKVLFFSNRNYFALQILHP